MTRFRSFLLGATLMALAILVPWQRLTCDKCDKKPEPLAPPPNMKGLPDPVSGNPNDPPRIPPVPTVEPTRIPPLPTVRKG